MYRIKRVKSASPMATPRTHWAVKVAPAGNVSLWTPDEAAAGAFDDATALKAESFYAAKAAAKEPVGTVTIEDAPEG